MKKILLFAFIILTAKLSFAQFTIDIQGGWSVPKGTDLEHNVKGGIGCSFDFMYTPDFFDNRLAFGASVDGNLLFGAGITVDDKTFNLKASKLSLSGAKARITLQDGVSPYAAITFGMGHLNCAVVNRMKNEETGEITYDKGFKKVNAFAVKPEIGMCFKIFTIGVGFMIPTKYGDMNSKTGCTQWNIGFRIPIDN